MQNPRFIPMSREEMTRLGWAELDVLLVTGDAYVDHPSFGAALISRYLVAQGFRTGIIAQPDWRDPRSVSVLGRPRLFAGITAGAMDSMVANYTANKKLRRDDAYAPAGQHGLRPNRASIIYTSLVRHAFPGLPVVLGGIEASLRRLVHYDYWENAVRRSLLLDAKADLLVYGMGERPVAEIAHRLAGKKNLDNIPGTAWVSPCVPVRNPPARTLPSYDEILKSKEALLRAALAEENERDWRTGRVLAQAHGQRVVVVEPPAEPLAETELDALYALPFTRQAHPVYTDPIPALEPVRTSITTHRGCFGGCSFCSLGAHQGKIIQSRSVSSILGEIERLVAAPDFHGTLTDLGGPSANMFQLQCQRPQGECRRPSCLFPQICQHLETSHRAQINLLRQASRVPTVRHVFVASGIRYDLALADRAYLPALVAGGHISGALKAAPEHVDPETLAHMRKPGPETFVRFVTAYREACRRHGQAGWITAYFIASFPGSDTDAARRIRDFARHWHLRIEQMQDFIPLPMTLAGVMYYTGLDPASGQPVHVNRSSSNRVAQRRVLTAPRRSAPPSRPARLPRKKRAGPPR